MADIKYQSELPGTHAYNKKLSAHIARCVTWPLSVCDIVADYTGVTINRTTLNAEYYGINAGMIYKPVQNYNDMIQPCILHNDIYFIHYVYSRETRESHIKIYEADFCDLTKPARLLGEKKSEAVGRMCVSNNKIFFMYDRMPGFVFDISHDWKFTVICDNYYNISYSWKMCIGRIVDTYRDMVILVSYDRLIFYHDKSQLYHTVWVDSAHSAHSAQFVRIIDDIIYLDDRKICWPKSNNILDLQGRVQIIQPQNLDDF
jgi:hypothetical protein